MKSFSLMIFIIFVFIIKKVKTEKLTEIHHHMTPDELEETFSTTTKDNIPKYELLVVDYSIFDKTSEVDSLRFKAFNDTFELKLKRINRSLFSTKTPIWFAEGSNKTKTVHFKSVNISALNTAIKFYEDPDYMAGIGIEEDQNGNLQFTGYIDERMVLKKVPKRIYNIWEKLFSKSENSHSTRSRKERGLSGRSAQHYLVYSHVSTTKKPPKKKISVRHVIEKQALANGSYTIYPRLFVFINFHEHYNSDRDPRFFKLLIYIICFWNAVNLKYSDFHEPEIKLHIAGIVIANNKMASPYLQKSIRPGSIAADGYDALLGFSKFLDHNNLLLGHWDIAISQSNVPLCLTTNCSLPEIQGISSLAKACNDDPRSNIKTMALILDNYNFSGIVPAAHEIGHIFGANHDSEGDSLCNDRGFIMSRHVKPSAEGWSWCNRFEILKKLKSTSPLCWNKIPVVHENETVPEFLPGHILSLQNQCILQGYDYACEEKSKTCENLYCWSKGAMGINWLQNCHVAGIPLTGSHCADKMHCKFGACVPFSDSI